MQGVLVCGNPNEGEAFHLLEACNDESAIEYFLLHIYNKRVEQLKRDVKEVLSEIQSVEENKDAFILIANDVTETRINKSNDLRLINENISETKQSVIIDLEFVKDLPIVKQHVLSKHILPKAINNNKSGTNPFELFLTNLGDYKDYKSIRDSFQLNIEAVGNSFTDKIYKELFSKEDLASSISDSGCLNSDKYVENWTEKCYNELFPKEKLVLISPLSENELVYDPDDVYIMTGVLDSDDILDSRAIEKAENDGIRHAKLPISEVVVFEARFTLDIYLAILQDYRWSQDWFYACRWIDPQYFQDILSRGPFTLKQEYTFLTHKKLFPECPYSDNGVLSPTEYRNKYAELVSLAPNDTKLHWSTKYHSKRRSQNKVRNYQY